MAARRKARRPRRDLCTVLRTFREYREVYNPATGTAERVQGPGFYVEPCGVGLFTKSEQDTGICRYCRDGRGPGAEAPSPAGLDG